MTRSFRVVDRTAAADAGATVDVAEVDDDATASVGRVSTDNGVTIVEVVVDGWRFELEVEPAERAALRERARRGGSSAGAAGPLEIRAIIPGRVVSLSVQPGQRVRAGDRLLVLEAMKMQNELRAPRDGTVGRVAVLAGQTVELGDVLLTLE